MKITTLVENTAASSEYGCKHGLSFYIETANHKLLFDLGPDELFLRNAEKLGVDIGAVDTVVISHGHNDHGGALKLFLERNHTARVYIRENAFLPYYVKILGVPSYAGLDSALKSHEQIVLTGEECIIDDELRLFSGVTERECYARTNNALYEKTKNRYVHDAFAHEQNLIITENGRTVLFGGCAHNGIVNILHKAELLLGKQPNVAISGMHLYNPVSIFGGDSRLTRQIGERLRGMDTRFCTCHCTGKKAYGILKDIMGEKIDYLAAGSVIAL